MVFRRLLKKYSIVTPWILGGDGTVGFTQTYLSNWKKGGKSALSTLVVLKGFANYSLRKVKWENSIGNQKWGGWNPADDKIQKNDDKFEVISRFGLVHLKNGITQPRSIFKHNFLTVLIIQTDKT